MKTNIGYVVAYKKSTRKNTKEYYLVDMGFQVFRTDYIIEASVFETKEKAQNFIDSQNNSRLYVKSYDIEVI